MTRLAVRARASRSPRWPIVVAQAALVLVLVVAIAVMWLLIVNMWMDALRRSMSPIYVLAATAWWV
jgi:hypothetical protein